MNDQLKTASGESSPEPERAPVVNVGSGVKLGALIALAVAAAIVVWIMVGRGSSNTPRVMPVAPVALSAGGLKSLSAAVPEPIYWAGPRPGYLYELKRTTDGSVYIRYLPPGVEAGASGNYLVIATHPSDGAYEALEKESNGRAIRVANGGLTLVDAENASSVRVAFPNVDYQVEVVAGSNAEALATSARVRPA